MVTPKKLAVPMALLAMSGIDASAKNQTLNEKAVEDSGGGRKLELDYLADTIKAPPSTYDHSAKMQHRAASTTAIKKAKKKNNRPILPPKQRRKLGAANGEGAQARKEEKQAEREANQAAKAAEEDTAAAAVDETTAAETPVADTDNVIVTTS